MSKHIEVYPVERARERSLYICNQFEKTAKFRETIVYINERIEDAASKGRFMVSINFGNTSVGQYPVQLFADLPTSSMNTLIAYLEDQGYQVWKTNDGDFHVSWAIPEASANHKPCYNGIRGYQPISGKSKSSPPKKP